MKISRIPWPAGLAVVVVGFLGFAAVSFWNHRLAVVVMLTWASLVALISPGLLWGLALFAAPFQSLFAMDSGDFGRIRTGVVVLLLLRFGAFLLTRRTYRSPLVWFLLGFTALLIAHDLGVVPWPVLLREVSFCGALGLIYVVSRHFGSEARGMALGQAAIAASALVSGGVAFLFLYWPFPDLSIVHQRHLDNLRLFGIQDNPNALAKLLLPAFLLAACSLVFQRRPRASTIALMLVSAVFIAATGTKSVLLAAMLMLAGLPVLQHPACVRAPRFWLPAALAMVAVAAWLVGIGPAVERHAARQWIARHESDLGYYLLTCLPGDPCTAPSAQIAGPPTGIRRIEGTVARDLRLSTSYAMTQVGGRTEYTRRASGGLELGQRDRTWRAGLQIVARHWIWGIGGPTQWARQMQVLTGYPFSSPHNALLEVAGGYGVFGLLLYILVIAASLRAYAHLRRRVREPWQRLANEWILVSVIAVVVVEMTDVLTVFGMFTLHAMWFWGLLGLQSGVYDAVSRPDAAAAAGARTPPARDAVIGVPPAALRTSGANR